MKARIFPHCQRAMIIVAAGLFLGVVMASAQQSAPGPSPGPSPANVLPDEMNLNLPVPSIIGDVDREALIRMAVPQWAFQQLNWPKQQEIENHLGAATPGQTREAALWISRTLNHEYVLPDLSEKLIALRNWAVLYRDWVNHGGSDSFLVKYTLNRRVIQVVETTNYVLVAVRDLDGKKISAKAEHMNHISATARRILSTALQPADPGNLGVIADQSTGEVTVGFWAPGGMPPESGTSEKTSAGSQLPSDSIKFCTDGDFVIFQVLKYIWGVELQNPFEPRFGPRVSIPSDNRTWQMIEEILAANPDLDTPRKRIEFWERFKDRIVMKEAEEYLGSLLYDSQGNKITSSIPLEQLERAFMNLNIDQREMLITQRMIDENYIKGLKAFNENHYDEAIDRWVHVLELDPLNVRAAILLSIAVEYKKEFLAKIQHEGPAIDTVVTKALDTLAKHQAAVQKERLTERAEDERSRKIASHRIRAMEFYTEGDYEKAIQEWDAVMQIDPGNPQASMFRKLAADQLVRERKKLEEAQPSPTPNSP
jgi:tetratricopeptide (TPR) repeat protein